MTNDENLSFQGGTKEVRYYISGNDPKNQEAGKFTQRVFNRIGQARPKKQVS